MMRPLDMLLRLNERRLDDERRRLARKLAELAGARDAEDRARAALAESAATLPKREDALYDPVMRRSASMRDMEDVKESLVALTRAHATLADARDRGEHVRRRVESETEAAKEAQRRLHARRIKYELMRDEMARSFDRAAERREEADIEDLTARGRARKP